MRTRLPLLALAVLSLFAAAACSSDDDPSTVEAGEEQEEQKAEFNDADVAFAQQMIPHHQQAVEMAQLADRADRQEVKDLAARVEAATAPELAAPEACVVDRVEGFQYVPTFIVWGVCVFDGVGLGWRWGT